MIEVDPPFGRLEKILLVILLALAALLRCHDIGKHCFWVDEVATVQLASGHPLGVFDFPTDQVLPKGFYTADPFGGSAADVIRAVRGDTHPPLYLLTLRYWRQLFGPGDAAARSLSAVCGIVAIFFLFDAVRVLHGRSAAWMAAILMTFATPQIEYAQEARSYMMVVMWTTAAMAAMARLIQRGITRRRQIALGIALLAGMCTHYYGAAIVAAVAAYALWDTPALRKAVWTVCGVVGLLFVVIIGPLLFAQRTYFHANMTWIADDAPGLWLRTLGRISVLPLRWFIIPLTSSLTVAGVSGVLLLLPWLRLRVQPRLLLWSLVMLAVVAMPTAADLINHSKSLFQVRYTLPASVAAYAIVAVFFLNHATLRYLLPATLVLGSIISLPQAYEQSHKLNWNVLGQEVAALAGPDQPIVFYQETPADWHGPVLQVGIPRYGPLWDRPLLAITKPINAETRQALQQRGSFWIISGTFTPPVDRFVPGAKPTGRMVPAPFAGCGIEFRIASPATTQAAQ